MNYLTIIQSYYSQLLKFWEFNGLIVTLIACVVLVLFLLVNVFRNDYRAINRKLKRSCGLLTKLVADGNHTKFVKNIPQPYYAQYQCYLATKGIKANQVMSFVPVKQKTVGILWCVLAVIVFAFDAYFRAVNNYHYSYFFVTAGAVLFIALSIFLIALSHRLQMKVARKIVERYIDILSAINGNSNGEQAEPFVSEQKVDNTVKAIKMLGNCPEQDQSMARVAELLRDKALKGQRTVKQQRKINRALNDLMINLAHRKHKKINNATKPAVQEKTFADNSTQSVSQKIVTLPTFDSKPEQPVLQ